MQNDAYSRQFWKQAIVSKLLLPKSYYRMFFIGQNLSHILKIFSFDKLLILFWLTLVDISCLKIFFSHCLRIHTIKRNKRWHKNQRNTFSFVSDVDVEEPRFSMKSYKIPYKIFLIFLSFMNIFLVFLLKLRSNYIAILYVLAEVWILMHL